MLGAIPTNTTATNNNNNNTSNNNNSNNNSSNKRICTKNKMNKKNIIEHAPQEQVTIAKNTFRGKDVATTKSG